MRCSTIKKNPNKVCIADLDKRIQIQTTSITGSNKPNEDSSVGFSTIATVWAMIKTSPNYSYINGVNTQTGINTDFYIRYNSSVVIDKELYVEWNNIKFKVTSSENIDKEDSFLRLRAIEFGDKSLNANLR